MNDSLSIVIVVAVALGGGHSIAGEEQVDPRNVLKQAYDALGGKQNLLEIHSLLVEWTSSGVTSDIVKAPARTETELRLLLPDRYRKTDIVKIKDWEPVKLDTILAGEHVYIDGMRDDSQREAYWFAMARHQLTFLMDVRTRPGEVRVVYRGRWQLHGESADVVDFLKDDGFLVGRVYVSTERGLPLEVAYGTEYSYDRFGTIVVPRVQQEPVQIRLSGYESVDGVLFPTRMTLVRDGSVHEEIQVTSYVVNERVTEEDFVVQ